ncbi:MAG: hypothetical protein U0228_14375 [Myxococcaceae bacterium]
MIAFASLLWALAATPAAEPISLNDFISAAELTLTTCSQEIPEDKKACQLQIANAKKVLQKGTRFTAPWPTGIAGRQVEVDRRELSRPDHDCSQDWASRGMVTNAPELVITTTAPKEPPSGEVTFEVVSVTRKSIADKEMTQERKRQLTYIDAQLAQTRNALAGVPKEYRENIQPQLDDAIAQRECIAAFQPTTIQLVVVVKLVPTP